jgi:hypothetical protein
LAILPWILGAAAFATILAALFVTERQGRATPPANPVSASTAGSGTPPDLSQMSPRERFDRLYNRVMQASESGDTATVSQFTSMALAAYGMLDSVDADARYHAAMLRLHTGDGTGAAALADTILAKEPSHLLGFVIHGTIARWQRDQAELAAAQRRFLSNYEAEQSSNRSEYRDHKTIIDRFLEEARNAVSR